MPSSDSDDSSGSQEADSTDKSTNSEDNESEYEDASDPAEEEVQIVHRTSTKRRCRDFVRRCYARGTNFLKDFSKENWARQGDAQEAASGSRGEAQAEGTDGAGLDTGRGEGDTTADLGDASAAPAPSAATAPSAAPAPPAGAGETHAEARHAGGPRAAKRKRQSILSQPETFMCFVFPDGHVDYAQSKGIKEDALCRHQRDLFVAALQLKVKQEQIRQQNHPGNAGSTKINGRSIRAEQGSKPAPRSKQLRTAARAAFREYVGPVRDRAQASACGAETWRACVVKEGHVSCGAGGGCRKLRAELKWPDDLACVDPNRAHTDTQWCIDFLEWLKGLGFLVQIPPSAAEARCSPSF